MFGPGAIIASLTIGTGELIFSSRGGALFGYRTLCLFLVILLLKLLHGGMDYCWGAVILTIVLAITTLGGYSTLERIQLVIVAAMMLGAAVTLFLYHPDWLALLRGAFVPQSFEYPAWLGTAYPDIAAQPVWVETTRYVGVIGGSGFDYMAYTSYVRDKAWGQAAEGPASAARLAEIAGQPTHPVCQWLRAPLVDCSLSFLVIIVFSAVFVVAGTIILGPRHEIPHEQNLLGLQSAFVTRIHPWLLPLYVAGALLAMLGTLYGTLEIACCIAAEITRSVSREFAVAHARRIRRTTLVWCALVAYTILAWLCIYQLTGANGRPRLLLSILTPANLLTGVLGCGIFCVLILWMDQRFLPRPLRLPKWLWLLNAVSACVFVGLGCKGYVDDTSRWYALAVLSGMLLIGVGGGYLAAAWRSRRPD